MLQVLFMQGIQRWHPHTIINDFLYLHAACPISHIQILFLWNQNTIINVCKKKQDASPTWLSLSFRILLSHSLNVLPITTFLLPICYLLWTTQCFFLSTNFSFFKNSSSMCHNGVNHYVGVFKCYSCGLWGKVLFYCSGKVENIFLFLAHNYYGGEFFHCKR